jgi:hypothetical protein
VSKRGKLPLDDPRWLPVIEAHKRQCELTGEPQLAARELTEAMARERNGLRSMRRSIYDADPDRELLTPSHWTKYQLWWRLEAKTAGATGQDLIVRSRDRSDPKGPDGDIGPSYSYAYYIWRPDLERLWSQLRSPPSPPPATPDHATDVSPPRRKPGPKTTDDWPMLIAAKLIHMARYDPEALGNVDALVKSMQRFLQDEIGWAPQDPKQVREKIVSLLRFVRR